MGYSWDDDNDFDTSGGTGFSYQKARRSYDDVAVAKHAAKAFYNYKSDFPETQAAYPIIVGIDTTGSMQKWPEVFFDKLPLLYQEAVKYLPGCEISFQAINDWFADGRDNALQPAPFAAGAQLDEIIGQLHPVGGGGGQGMESYELFAAYNGFVKTPGALIKPVAIILGDEAPFENVPDEAARYYGLTEGPPYSCKEAFARLHDKCDVFLVHKSYGPQDGIVLEAWREHALMSDERILHIEDPKRVVDVILGIVGILTGKHEMFERELKERQTPGQVQEVLSSLHRLNSVYHTQQDSMQRSVSLNKGVGNVADTEGLELDEID